MLSPQRHLVEISRRYPNAWRGIEHCLAGRGKDLPNWPRWCFCPVAAAHAVVFAQHEQSGKSPAEIGFDIPAVAALAAWRITQGIYRFDPDIASALMETPLSKIPRDVLYNLPEWCVYVEVEKDTPWGHVVGFFAYLEWDTKDFRHELRLLLDTSERLIPAILHISESAYLEDALRSAYAEARRNAPADIEFNLDPEEDASNLAPFVSLLLYLCSEEPDVEAGNRKWPPVRPRLTKTKTGMRMFQAEKPSVWETTFRLGRAMRQAQASCGSGDSDRSSVRAHIRRAHWHSFWTGVKSDLDKRRIVLKWLNPILVNFEGDEIIPTIRKVKGHEIQTDENR